MTNSIPPHYFFCGIGGSGMSALARILLARGARVSGSDRSYDQGQSPDKYAGFVAEDIVLFPQDGSGITDEIDVLVVSSAVEESIPDVRVALKAGIPIQKRAALLAALFNTAQGIGIGGTSGKTTVTAMIGHILHECGRAPTVMNGGLMSNFHDENTGKPTNAVISMQKNGIFVSELDESDGSIALFDPFISVLTNITLDHKPLDELRPLFRDYLARTKKGCVVNLDDPESVRLKDVHPRTVTFGIENEAADLNAIDIELEPLAVSFFLSGEAVHLPLPGRYNVSNALAALGSAQMLDIPLAESLTALESFKGVHRRFEIIGTTDDNITVIDDFAHNPDKIAACMGALKEFEGRVIAVFQPHGFGPTKLLKNNLIETFANVMDKDDVLLMPEIYYAGGTADKVISSCDIVEGVKAAGREAHFFETRAQIVPFITKTAQSGDRIIIMGARDDTLPDFAKDVLDQLG